MLPLLLRRGVRPKSLAGPTFWSPRWALALLKGGRPAACTGPRRIPGCRRSRREDSSTNSRWDLDKHCPRIIRCRRGNVRLLAHFFFFAQRVPLLDYASDPRYGPHDSNMVKRDREVLESASLLVVIFRFCDCTP